MKLLKIGGSAITDKSDYKKARPEQIELIAKQIAGLWKQGQRDMVLVHGAGSFGHKLVIRHKLDDGIETEDQKLGLADTHLACAELSLLVVKALVGQGVPAIPVQPSDIIISRNKRISEFRKETVMNYLSSGYLPVLYGDMVPDVELGGSVCSGDQIMAWLGRHAEFLVFATNVDGVLDDKGNVIEQINEENFQEISKHLKQNENDVTGAMKGKIQELLELGRTSYIVNASKPERISDILMGKETICTKIE